MTIGYVLDDTLDKPDGVQQAMISIAEHMRSLGHNVHYIVAETKRTDLKHVHSIGRFWSMKFNGNSVRTPKPASKQEIKQLFTDVKFDVLHVQSPHSPLLSGRVMAAAPKSTKIFGTFHILPYNSLTSLGTKLAGISMRRNLQLFDHMFAVSEPARVFMEKSFGIAGSVLPNPVDYDYYSSKKRHKHAKKQIVFVGRFDERKGVKQLVQAYANIPDNVRKDLKLIMCGKGPLHEEVTTYSKEHSLDIALPGFVTESEKAQYLADADVAVFPSVSGESFGIVLTEAMAAGASITLGGNNPGYASVLGKWPEVLFDPNDTSGLSDLLVRVSTDTEFVKLIGPAQHEYAKQFDIRLIADQLLVAYTK